jgi:hypothetical protein
MITQHPKATRTKIGEGTLPIRNDSEIANGSLTIPAELTPFVEPCFLLSGESSREFGAIRQMMIDDIQPTTNVEWLWTLDLVELSWEILRYRRLKKRILNAHREAAIEAILRRLDGAGMPAEAIPMLQIRTRRTAAEWRCDPEAACDIEARLQRSGIDSIDIDAEVFVQARELFLMFDKLMCSAQNRRIALLREFSIRREFAARVRRVLPGTGRLESSFP